MSHAVQRMTVGGEGTDLDLHRSLGSTAGFIVMNVGTYGGGVPLWSLARGLGAAHPISRALPYPATSSR